MARIATSRIAKLRRLDGRAKKHCNRRDGAIIMLHWHGKVQDVDVRKVHLE